MADHVCPWWVGYLLAIPLRRWVQNPERILRPHVEREMTVLDVGCAMGFFSLALARQIGSGGRVVCVDVQPKMLEVLGRRARRAGLAGRLDLRVCSGDDLAIDDLDGQVDFALAFAVVHEVPDPPGLMTQIRSALRPRARLMIAEPSGHVGADAFEETVSTARQAGFEVLARPRIARSQAVLVTGTNVRDAGSGVFRPAS